MKAYIASGWFTDEQEEARQDLLEGCKQAGIEVYSPKEDMLYTPGMEAKEVFEENIIRIVNADFVLASTAGKDMGTLFECGAAYMCSVPIVYYYTGKGKFNLMLSESARIVIQNKANLFNYLSMSSRTCHLERVLYGGPVE